MHQVYDLLRDTNISHNTTTELTVEYPLNFQRTVKEVFLNILMFRHKL